MTSSNAAFELASTLQSASINHHPDPQYDANPSTSFSQRIPVRFRPQLPLRQSSSSDPSTVSSHEIPLSVLQPPPRNPALPPLPDLRFEQSYLARIAPYSYPPDGGPPRYMAIAWLTLIDHLVLPFSQGLLWNLVIHGWRTWNEASRFSGRGVGARVRRWWWGVNGWKVPMSASAVKVDTGVGLESKKLAEEVRQYFEFESGSAGMD